MKCLVNILCTLLIASASIGNSVSQTSSKTTYEDTARQRKLAEEENYAPSTIQETTTIPTKRYIPGEGVFKNANIPDYETRLREAESKEPYIAKEISDSYSAAMARNRYKGMTPPVAPLDPYGPRVNIRETHTMGSDGEWRPKGGNFFEEEKNKGIVVFFLFCIICIILIITLDQLYLRRDIHNIKKTVPTKPEKKWLSCDSTITTHTDKSRIIPNIHKIAFPINVLGKQTGDLEKVITFILSLTEEGIKNFGTIEGLSKTQQLEVFLFDACMAKNFLLAKEKIPNAYVPEVDKNINEAYQNLKEKLRIKVSGKFLDAKDLMEIRFPVYLNDLQSLLDCNYPQTKMYMPYGLYFFIHVAPLETIFEKEEAIEEIINYQSDTKVFGNVLSFMKAFEPHYNWLLDRINSF